MVWIVIRALMVVAGAALGPDVARTWEDGFDGIALIGVFLAFAGLGIVVVLGMCRFVRLGVSGSTHWQRPSWRIRPFFGQPLQFFHGASWWLIAAGLSAVIFASMGEGTFQGSSMVGGLGIGTLAATQLYVRMFPEHFESEIAAVGSPSHR